MKTEELIEIVKKYIVNPSVDSALLVNGKWGSGKTFFWKNVLEKIANENRLIPIYISLNGLNEIKQVENLIFISLIPIPLKKNKSSILLKASNLFSHINIPYLNGSPLEIAREYSLEHHDFSKHIVCFDDLERCQLPIKEILGFINKYIEHKKLKTIILADEPKLIDASKSEADITNKYESIKEKVISRVVNFEPGIKETFPQLLKKYENEQAFHQFLVQNQQFIINCLEEYDENNLRIVYFFLDVLSEIYALINTLHQNYLHEIIMFTLIICIEFKNGNLKSSEYHDTKGLNQIDKLRTMISLIRSSRIKQNNGNSIPIEVPYNESFFERYIENRSISYYFYYEIYKFVLSGFINTTGLIKEINYRIPPDVSEERKALDMLINYNYVELDDEEFIFLTSKVLEYAQNGSYPIYHYRKLAEYYYSFIERKLFPLSEEEITDRLIAGISIAKLRKEYISNYYSSILQSKNENNNLLKIESLIKEIHNQWEKDEGAEKVKVLIESFKNQNIISLENFLRENLHNDDIINLLNTDELLDAVHQTSNKALILFINFFGRRYSSINAYEYYAHEIPFLENFLLKCEEAASDESIKVLRKYILKWLCNDLNLHIEKLKVPV